MISLYRKCSIKVTDFFVNRGIIPDDKKPVYEYGFEILISTMAYAVIFILISLVTKTLFASVMFFASFCVVRTIGGGYHANTYLKCHIISATNHLLFVFLYSVIPQSFSKQAIIIMLGISAVIMFVLAPVEHPNKPFIKSERKRFRQLSLLYSTVLIALSIVTFCLYKKSWNACFISYSIGTISAAISIIVAKINHKKGKKEQ